MSINQILFGQRTWLDVLENDFTNTQANQRRRGLHLSTYLWIIRLLQKMLPWNNIITLAEECFYNEIKFCSSSPLLLGHELVKLPLVEQSKTYDGHVVLVTGTLGRHYGTLDAVAWSERQQATFPNHLRIVGHAPDPAFAQELRVACKAHPSVELTLYPTYRPQEEILVQMAQAHYLLCPYHISPATRNRIPTKFAEAAHTGCTLIFPPNPAWERWCKSRNVPFRFMESPQVAVTPSREALPSDWVAQRIQLQENATRAALAHIREQLVQAR